MLVFEKLEPAVHNRQQFSCGNEELDVFLKKYAAQNQRIGQSTTHVLVNTERREEILGFITLCSSALSIEDLNPSDLRRLPRYPIPAIKIARLAVSSRFQGNKVGSALLGHRKWPVFTQSSVLRRLKIPLCIFISLYDS